MKKLLILGALMLGLTTPAFAQPAPLNLTGQETVTVTLLNGSGVAIPISQFRNVIEYTLVPTGTTVTSTGTPTTGSFIATGAITTWSVTLPNPAYDGQVFTVANSTASAFTTNTTVTAPAGGVQTQTLAVAYSGQTLAANGGRASWLYAFTSPTAGTWYRVE